MILRPTFLVLMLAVLTACDSSTVVTTTTSVPSTTTSIAGEDEGTRRFRECLALNGIGIAPIETDGTGRPRLDLAVEGLDMSDPEVSGAVAACSAELGSGALDLSTDDLLRQVVIGQLEEFSVCMRERGIENFPDPEPGFNGVGSAYSVAEIPYSDPALAAVAEVCSRRVFAEFG